MRGDFMRADLKNTNRILLGCCVPLAMLIALAGAPATGAEKVVYSFQGGSDGVDPGGPLIADNIGNFYGPAGGGGGGTGCKRGNDGCGAVFKLASDGTEAVLHAFAGGCDGAFPSGGLAEDGRGNLYGTTQQGGECNNNEGLGTVFEIAADGTESVLHAFKGGSDGELPSGTLILDKKGNLYGTTPEGGNLSDCDGYGCGTVFELTPKGKKTVIYAFQGGNDGLSPQGAVIMDNAGNLYGTTGGGGGSPNCDVGCGTVFKIAPGGIESVLYSFQGGSDGSGPITGLTADSAGNLYGTTTYSGSNDDGTVFKVTPGGTETVLYSFQPGGGGEFPDAGVILDKAGNLYGTTYEGGDSGCKGRGCGVVFKLAPDGTETVLYAFGSRHGASPAAGLLMGKNDTLYGTTTAGGKDRDGVVFKVTTK